MRLNESMCIGMIGSYSALAFSALLLFSSLKSYAGDQAYFRYSLKTATDREVFLGRFKYQIGEDELAVRKSGSSYHSRYHKSDRVVLKIEFLKDSSIPLWPDVPIWLFSERGECLYTATTTYHLASELCDWHDVASVDCCSDACCNVSGLPTTRLSRFRCLLPLLCWSFCGPIMLGRCALRSRDHALDESSRRRGALIGSTKNDQIGATVLEGISITTAVGSGAVTKGNQSLSPEVRVIYLIGNDLKFLSWLREMSRNNTQTDVPVVIPGFVHYSKIVNPVVTALGDDPERITYTVKLYIQKDPALLHVEMEVSAAKSIDAQELSDYVIHRFEIIGNGLELKLERQ